MTKSTQVEVFNAVSAIVPPRMSGSAIEPGLRLREDLNVGSLALVSISMTLCDTFGVDPTTLDLGSFIDRANTVGDLVAIVDELRAATA